MPQAMRLLSATWKSFRRPLQLRIAWYMSFSSMFMWNTSMQTPHVGADVLGQRERLIVPVQEVGLEAVERLDGEADALALAVLVALLQAVDRPAATPAPACPAA